MKVVFLVLMFVLGSCLGSFLCCQARRLHIKSKVSALVRFKSWKTPKHRTSQPNRSESKLRSSDLGPRSICLHCKYQLPWYDNIPILSWLFLKGKCRKCRHSIGIAEFLSEIGVACAFVCVSFVFDPSGANALDWITLVISLVFATTICFLAIYDGLYGELPVAFLTISIILAAVLLVLRITNTLTIAAFSLDLIWRPALSALILGGLYLVLYLISKGKWVGDGDWLLGLALALAIYNPWLALLILFLANFLACLVMLPSFYKSRRHTIYFGPFLVTAFFIIYAFATPLNSLIGV